MLAFAASAYVVTVLTGAVVLFRQQQLADQLPSFATVLAWQAIVHGLWLPVAALVWVIFRRDGITEKTIVTFALLGLVAIPTHAVFATMVDISFSKAGGADLLGLAVSRLQLNTLTYAAFGLVAGAAALHRRATEEARAAREISAALKQAQRRSTTTDSGGSLTLPVTIGPKRAAVPLHDVEWFGSASNYVVVNWAGREALMRRTLQSLEQELDPLLFARSHRGTIVNLGKVAAAEPLSDGSWRLSMNSGAEVVVSRTYRDDILQRLRETGVRP